MKKILFVIGVLGFLFGSCKKYLDKKSDSTLVTPSTIEDLQGLLDDANVMNLATPSFGEESADDYFLLQNSFNTLTQIDKGLFTWTDFYYQYGSDYSKAYIPVYNANLCLERIEEIKKTAQNQDKWNNIKGSAYFYRAHQFLNLAWVFAKAYDETTSNDDLGIVLRLSTDPTVRSVRSTLKQTYDQIISDATESILYLNDNPSISMRPSKAASYGLLARTYLSMRQYDSAFKYSDLCLKIKNSLIDYNSTSAVNVNASIPFKRFNQETIFYTQITSSLGSVSPFLALIDTTLFLSYSSTDKRKNAFFASSGGYKKFKGSYAQSSSLLFSGISTDEMYITRAECYARAQNKDAALSDLNTLLSKRISGFVPVTATTAQNALNIILLERRKELLMRGLRWLDVKRLNKEGASLTLKRIVGSETYTLTPNDKRYAIPLPNDIVGLGIPQN